MPHSLEAVIPYAGLESFMAVVGSGMTSLPMPLKLPALLLADVVLFVVLVVEQHVIALLMIAALLALVVHKAKTKDKKM